MRQIKDSKNGAEIKKLGQQYNLIKAKQWDSFSSTLMKDLIKSSFEQNPKALERLLSTGNAEFTHKFRGVEQDGGRFSRLLMEVRDELRKEREVKTDPFGTTGDIEEPEAGKAFWDKYHKALVAKYPDITPVDVIFLSNEELKQLEHQLKILFYQKNMRLEI